MNINVYFKSENALVKKEIAVATIEAETREEAEEKFKKMFLTADRTVMYDDYLGLVRIISKSEDMRDSGIVGAIWSIYV